MSFLCRSRVIVISVLLAAIAGCVPLRGTMPTRTWRPDDPAATCAPDAFLDRSSPAWSASARSALARKLERGEPAVVSALGCRVEVLERCSAPGSYQASNGRYELATAVVRAHDLDGECEDATHVVRSAGGQDRTRVELVTLSLDPSEVSGIWSGLMRQPGGPYEVYDVRLELAQHGDRVTGVQHAWTIDGRYFGVIRFEGRLAGNTLYFADVEVLDDNLDIFLEWCGKGGYLLIDPREGTLHGPWSAPMCSPGTVELELERAEEEEGSPVAAAR